MTNFENERHIVETTPDGQTTVRRNPLLPVTAEDAVRFRKTTVEDLLGPEVVADYEAKEAAARKVARDIVRRSQQKRKRR